MELCSYGWSTAAGDMTECSNFWSTCWFSTCSCPRIAAVVLSAVQEVPNVHGQIMFLPVCKEAGGDSREGECGEEKQGGNWVQRVHIWGPGTSVMGSWKLHQTVRMVVNPLNTIL